MNAGMTENNPFSGRETLGVVAFLQNLWVRDPDRVRRLIAVRGENFRRMFMDAALFGGCLTGRRLEAAFGDLRDGIVWEEASREIGGYSAAAFPADPAHIRAVIEELKPRVVLTFGKIATAGVLDALPSLGELNRFSVITGPHPAARHATVCKELADMAALTRERLAA